MWMQLQMVINRVLQSLYMAKEIWQYLNIPSNYILLHVLYYDQTKLMVQGGNPTRDMKAKKKKGNYRKKVD